MFKILSLMKTPLLKWYSAEKRELPWRLTNNPYYIWLSEIILQQTRVDQGLSYYLKFVDMFPDVFSLANASEEKVLKAWQGLGYYSRARNLHKSAQIIVSEHNGIFPVVLEDVLKLKGIGPYTAAAILSIAFNQVLPVCDGNVERVVCRYLAIQYAPKQAIAQKAIHEFLNANIDHKRPGDFNQAMMELGALICKPSSPDCQKCPISKHCKAFADDLTATLPVKAMKVVSPKRYYYYMVIHPKGEDSLYLRKRTAEGVWKNLWDFPLIESETPLNTKKLKETDEWANLFGKSKIKQRSKTGPVVHKLSHRDLIVYFIEIDSPTGIDCNEDIVKVTMKQAQKYPVSQLIANYITDKD